MFRKKDLNKIKITLVLLEFTVLCGAATMWHMVYRMWIEKQKNYLPSMFSLGIMALAIFVLGTWGFIIVFREYHKSAIAYARQYANKIYTIGHKSSYEHYFDTDECPVKKGRTKAYVGGSVWKTREEAEAHRPTGYKVYGVLADWKTETEMSLAEDCHDLLVNAKLVRLEEIYEHDKTSCRGSS